MAEMLLKTLAVAHSRKSDSFISDRAQRYKFCSIYAHSVCEVLDSTLTL